MTVTVEDSAREDAAQAVRMYNSKPGRYGTAFADEFEAAVELIRPWPRRFPRAEDAPAGAEVWEVFIDRFQQRVLFSIDGDTARVFAVVHADASPRRWVPRIPTPPTE